MQTTGSSRHLTDSSLHIKRVTWDLISFRYKDALHFERRASPCFDIGRPAGCLADYVISGWARVEVTEISRCVNGAGQQMFDCRFSSRPNGVTHIGFSSFRPINERRKRDKKKMAAGQRTAPSNFRRRVYSERVPVIYTRVRWRFFLKMEAKSPASGGQLIAVQQHQWVCAGEGGCKKKETSVRPSVRVL